MPTTLQLPTEVDLVEFISKEAHDLKSPFNRILGFLKLVLKGMDGPIPDQAMEDLTTVHKNSLYAMLFMNSLVDMARLSRDERKLYLADCQVEHVLQQSVKDWNKQYPRARLVEVAVSSPESSIRVDEMLLRQGLSNWMSFVAEFVEDDALITLHVEDEPGSCLFTIRSAGKKLPPPPQCDLTIYSFIALRIIDLHGGALRCAEEDERGSVVRFTLPKP